MSLNPEKIVGGHYKIIGKEGKVGFGQTYLAQDMRLPGEHRCIIKEITPLNKDPFVLQEAQKRFDSEAKALYSLGTYDRIPQVFADFQEDDTFYLVRQFIPGQDLSKELTLGKPLPSDEVIQLLQDILEVLAVVHQQKVIHRDIKPSNLIRRQKDGKILLIDFGAVKEIITLAVNEKGEIEPINYVGTEGYMPAEQWDGNPKYSSDIYAVGMLCIQALTGLHPISILSDPDTNEKVWRSLVENISPQFADILDRMVRYHFQNRYQSVAEVSQDLQSLLLKGKQQQHRSGNAVIKGLKITVGMALIAVTGLTAVIFLLWAVNLYKSQSNQKVQQELSLVAIDPFNTLKLARNLEDNARQIVSVSRDGTMLASVGPNQSIEIRNFKNGKLIETIDFYADNAELQKRDNLSAIAFSPDGKLLAASNSHQIELWQTQNWQQVTWSQQDFFPGNTGLVYALTFTPDSQTLISGGGVRINLWNLNRDYPYENPISIGKERVGKETSNNPYIRKVKTVAVSPDGKTVAFGRGARIELWDVQNQQDPRLLETAIANSQLNTVVFSPNGKILASGSNNRGSDTNAIVILDLATKKNLREFSLYSEAVCLAFSKDGNFLVSGYDDGSIKIWNLGDENTAPLFHDFSNAHSDRVVSVAFIQDGKTLVSASQNGQIKVWQVSLPEK